MSLQALLSGGVCIPANPRQAGGQPAFNPLTLDEAADKVELVFRVPVTGSLTHVGIHIGTVTTAQNLTVGIETLDAATGNASGEAYGGSAPKTNLDPTALANTFQWVALATAATGATAGDMVAVTVSFTSTVGTVAIRAYLGNVGSSLSVTYVGLYNQTGAAWTKNLTVPCLGVKYTSTVYNALTYPISSLTETAYNSGTGTYDEYALKFKLPFPTRVIGAIVSMVFAEDADFYVKLFEGATERSSTPLMDHDIMGAGTTSRLSLQCLFSTPYTIVKDTYYYLSVVPATINNITLLTFGVDAAATMAAFDGGGDFIMGKRLNAGAWTDVDTVRPFICLLCDQFDDGVGGGGGNMNLIKPAVL